MNIDYTKLMLAFLEEAGEIALKYFDKSSPHFKKDQSIITKADKAVSSLAKVYLKPGLKTAHHILIDEEDQNSRKYLQQEVLNQKEFIWSVDPIDGTRLYANHMPLYGISIGLMKNLKPHLGAVYLPALKELYYCDEKNAYFVKDPFTKNQKQKKILPQHQQMSSQSVLMCDDNLFEEYRWDYTDCKIMMPTCAVVDLCWPLLGRGIGAVCRSYLWDIAGAWAIAKKVGFDFRSLVTGDILNSVDLRHFNTKELPWKLNNFYVLSDAKNFPIIRKKLKRI